MANIEIAGVCNLKCSYCFAEDHMQAARTSPASAFISLELFEKRLDFLDRSGIDQARLIGGEPTLHPNFPELIHRARQRGKQIVAFSHGLMPERALACLAALPPDECTVLINMNAMKTADGPSQQEEARRYTTIKRLGPRALLGFNIYQTNFQLDFLLPIILDAGCRQAIRLGLAHPTPSGQNEYLHPKEYPAVGQKIVQFARAAAERGVRLEFDCGFVRCMFSDEDIETLRWARADFGWRCSPILDVDISGGQAIHCFPLAGKIQAPVTGTVDASALRNELSAKTSPYRIAGIYRECSTCLFKQRGECPGGCLGHTMRRFRQTPFRLTVPAARPEGQALPVIIVQPGVSD